MARVAYVVGTARERTRRAAEMEPGVELVVPMTSTMGKRFERIIVGTGFNQRMRDASPTERSLLREWLNELELRLVAGGEMMGAP